ncbi:MAG: efflux RND transporter periplasmic adaptor subunit, partial [Tepidisphaeraceae bacterium]
MNSQTAAIPVIPVVKGEPEHRADAEAMPRIGTPAMLLLVLFALAFLGALFMLGWSPRKEHEAQLLADTASNADPRPIVNLVRPVQSAVTSDVVLPADVRAFQDTAIYPRAGGYLKRQHVDIGDRVEAGQLLAEIDAPDVDADLNQARANFGQARANADKAKSDMELAQSTLKRYEDHSVKEFLTPQQVEEKQSAAIQSEKAYEAARASEAASQAAIDKLATLQGFEKVTAPFAGIIITRNYDIGALLSASNTAVGRELFRLNQTDTLRVFVNVPQVYATTIRKGLEVKLTVRNFPGRNFIGTVERWSGALDSATRTVRCEVHVPNTDNALYPGMYGLVQFPVTQSVPPLAIPTAALISNAEGTQVAVVKDNKVYFQK